MKKTLSSEKNGLQKKENGENVKSEQAYDPMAVRWMDKYQDRMDNIWGKVPAAVKPTLVTLAVFSLGITMKGEWIIVLVHMMKHLNGPTESSEQKLFTWDNPLEYFRLNGILGFIVWASLVGYVIYFAVGGFIHWYFYVRQRDRPQDWKCQPNKFMDPELERHEIIFGSLCLLCNSIVSAFLACFIHNGGYCTIYYDLLEYGWVWLFVQLPLMFLYQDYAAYWMHRAFHFPWLYINFHKMHHKYKQPTAFSVTALHPVESITMQMVMLLPIFIIPLHYIPFFTLVFYIYYHGILDHSGVNFKAQWWQPWQPDAIFHDNHHQYFHVNFGFNIGIWDTLHGTARRKDRIYTEEIYYGEGKSIKEASTEEVQDDLKQRQSENPLAYRSSKLEFLEGMDKLYGSNGLKNKSKRFEKDTMESEINMMRSEKSR